MIGQLPKSLTINKKDYDIRYDFRACLDILVAFSDPDLEEHEKMAVAFTIFYIDEIPREDIKEAYEKMIWFLNLGGSITEENVKKDRLYDWEQDEQLIFSAVNHTAGFETREKEQLHFWTFMSYFYEIGDGAFTYITRIRDKLNKKEKLDESEKKFYKENKKLITLKTKRSEREQRIIDKINTILN